MAPIGSPYSDRFTFPLTRPYVTSVDLLVAFFHAPPAWVGKLAQLRDRVVSVFGIRPSAGDPRHIAPPYAVGQRVGFFRILALGEHEVLLGDDDIHLDFRTRLAVEPSAEGRDLVISTNVITKNWLGRAYFAVVKPIHLVIVPSVARRMVGILERRDNPVRS